MTLFNPTDLRNRIEQVGDLPTLPHVVQRLATMIGSPTVSAEEIGTIIERDQVLAAKVLRLANSPFYGFPSRIGSVSHAVIVLGFNVVKGLTLCASALTIMKDAGMNQLWRHSLGVAITAKLLATRLEIKNSEELFVSGLLHDIGKVVLYVKWPDVGNSIKDALKTRHDHSLFDVEFELTGLSHAEIGGYLAGLPTDASALETKLSRQAELRTLTRKYAADVDGVLAWAEESRRRLAQLDVSEDALTALTHRVDELAARVAAAAVALTKTRTKAATGLARAVTAELGGLAMADAEFSVAVSSTPAGPDDRSPLRLPSGETVQAGPDGADAVEFGFTAHRGMAVLPLAKSASGGELSRVMLALEVVLAASTAGTTMVFDEVDAGVGGRAAVQIGRRLARLARTHQVIVVTHLPQVAAYADTHLVVTAAGGGASVVRSLDDDERVAELARMLAGLGDSDTARAHARELLDTARGELN